MKIHKLNNETYAIFQTTEKGGLWMVHFIWGKKDFRLYLEHHPAGSPPPARGPVLTAKGTGEVRVERLQYLYNFEWYDFDRLGGHGLNHDEVRWKRGEETRYVELPKDFFAAAVELACLEFGLARQEPLRKAN